jgi:hypothetical protein
MGVTEIYQQSRAAIAQLHKQPHHAPVLCVCERAFQFRERIGFALLGACVQGKEPTPPPAWRRFPK